jgi:hypothetical protein
MKTKPTQLAYWKPAARRGFLMVDLMVGLAILSIAMMPLGYSFARERQALRIEYFHGVINEIVDGEMEILAAGAAKNLPDGSRIYPVQSRAAVNLPAGHFQLAKTGNHLRLEWQADEKCGLSPVVREITLK